MLYVIGTHLYKQTGTSQCHQTSASTQNPLGDIYRSARKDGPSKHACRNTTDILKPTLLFSYFKAKAHKHKTWNREAIPANDGLTVIAQHVVVLCNN
jgi:hypothetical protein